MWLFYLVLACVLLLATGVLVAASISQYRARKEEAAFWQDWYSRKDGR